MSESKDKDVVIVKSPVAPIKWAFLGTPQEGDDGKPPKYHINLILDLKDAKHKAFILTLAKAKKDLNVDTLPYKKETTGKGDGKKETGFISVKIWSNYKPKVINSQKSELAQEINDIGNGSKVRVAFTMSAYPAGKTWGSGVSLYLQAVQLLEKIPYTPNQVSVEDCEFEEEKEFEAVEGSALDVFENEKKNLTPEEDGDIPF